MRAETVFVAGALVVVGLPQEAAERLTEDPKIKSPRASLGIERRKTNLD